MISSTEALALDTLPKKLVVVGAGYIGLELGIAFAKFGSGRHRRRSAGPHPAALRQGTDRSGASAGSTRTASPFIWAPRPRARRKRALAVETADGKTADLPADKILVTVGRKPQHRGLGPRKHGGRHRTARFVKVDDQCRTSHEECLGHRRRHRRADAGAPRRAQGEMVAEIIAGHKRRFDPAAIAAVCFTEPEIVSPASCPRKRRAP